MTSIRTLSLAACAVAAAGSAALAAPPADPSAAEAVKRAFGNTIVSTYPDGRKGFLYLNADGTFTTLGRHRTSSTGKWSIKGAKVCLKRIRPPAPFGYCTAAPQGDSWPAKAVTGEKLRVQLVKGHVDS
ncbi:MAG: hypothetical protein JWO33_1398 [Caulobacteraceae bacterium]|nr:hypothetical protein [Caulobacteraceae bacterium]